MLWIIVPHEWVSQPKFGLKKDKEERDIPSFALVDMVVGELQEQLQKDCIRCGRGLARRLERMLPPVVEMQGRKVGGGQVDSRRPSKAKDEVVYSGCKQRDRPRERAYFVQKANMPFLVTVMLSCSDRY